MKTLHLYQKSGQPVAAILLCSAFILLSSPVLAQVLSVKGDKVNMRSGPGIENKIKWEYGDGFPLEVLKKQGDWLNVKDYESDTGWIHKSYLHNVPHVIVKVNKDQERTINIRSGPGSEHPVVGNAYYGVVFAKIEEKSNWVKVRHESGLTGWVSSSLLWGI